MGFFRSCIEKTLLFAAVLFPFIHCGNDLDALCGVFPPEIKTAAVLAPASQLPGETVCRAVKMLERAGLKVKVMPHTIVQESNRRKTLPGRLHDFNSAFFDPEVDIIMPIRGGSGSDDLLKHLDWEKIRSRKVIFMGFSNITFLTGTLFNTGSVYVISGPNLVNLTKVGAASHAHLRTVLAKKTPQPMKLDPLKRGDCEGKIFASHLYVLSSLVKKKKFKPDVSGRIVFLECTGRNEKIWRKVFDDLLASGFFNNAAGVIFCQFTNATKSPEQTEKMKRDFASKLSCPVYNGFPYGHEKENFALDFQRTVAIKNDTLVWLPCDTDKN